MCMEVGQIGEMYNCFFIYMYGNWILICYCVVYDNYYYFRLLKVLIGFLICQIKNNRVEIFRGCKDYLFNKVFLIFSFIV